MVFWKIPAVVLAFLTWWSASPTSLADASRREALRRQAAPKASRSLTNQDLPPAPPIAEVPPPDVTAAEPPATDVPPPGAAEAAVPKDAQAKDTPHDEAWWRDQMKTALDTLDRDQELALAVQSRINALTTDWTNRDDPAQKALLFDQRQKALAELERLKKDVAADTLAIDAIREDARRQGVPPGWIRGR